jgi:hypothetical protein
MQIPKADVLTALFQAGLDEDCVRWEYGGRYMYGKTCFGVVGNINDYSLFLVELATQHVEGYDWANEFAQHVRLDNMANEYIFYFPGIELTEEKSEDE